MRLDDGWMIESATKFVDGGPVLCIFESEYDDSGVAETFTLQRHIKVGHDCCMWRDVGYFLSFEEALAGAEGRGPLLQYDEMSILRVLRQTDAHYSSRYISEETGVPLQRTRRILQRLRKFGLVEYKLYEWYSKE